MRACYPVDLSPPLAAFCEAVITQNLPIINAVVAALALIATVVYVVLTYRLLKSQEGTLRQMREARESELSPNVLAYFEMPHGTVFIYLVVKNVGRSIAQNGQFTFDPPLRDSHGSVVETLPMLKSGIHALPPGGELRHFFDGFINYFGNKELPRVYNVHLTYTGEPTRQKLQSHQTLDLSSFEKLQYIPQNGIHELATSVERLVRDHARLSGTVEAIAETLTHGVRVTNPQVLTTDTLSDAPKWRSIVIAKLGEVRTLWQLICAANRETGLEIINLQSRCAIAADEIIALASYTPAESSVATRHSLENAAKKLFDVSRLRPTDFWQRQDDLEAEVIAIIEDATDKIRQSSQRVSP